MLFIYGPYMPLRLLEEITFWKLQEKEHTVVIREIAPNLEPQYVELLKSWEPIFDQTERTAHHLLGIALAAPQAVPPAVAAQTNALLHIAANQSRTFVAQLNTLIGVSRAIAGGPVAVTVVRHIIRESEYFLCVLATLLRPRECAELGAYSAGAAAPASFPVIGGHAPYDTERPLNESAVGGLHDTGSQAAAQSGYVNGAPSFGADGSPTWSTGESAGRPFEAVSPTAAQYASTDGTPFFGAAVRPNGSIGAAVNPPHADGTPHDAAHGVLNLAPFNTGVPPAGEPGSFGSAASNAPDAAGMPRDADRPRIDADGDRLTAATVPIGGHTLPPLPYPYNALEPHIDEETMRIHHDKHHQSYVDGLNKAEKELEKARQTGDFALIKHWERELAFNGAGHYLHTLFWNVMSPHGGGPATGSLGSQLARDFGSIEAFKNHFSNAAEKVEGGGWAILVWSPRSRRLEILTAEKHQNLTQWDVVPVLPIDVWEHSYYLKYRNKRADYIKAWWNVINWAYVNQRFTEARKLVWPPY